jgi:hypothetical protein
LARLDCTNPGWLTMLAGCAGWPGVVSLWLC